jgi:DNA-binding LacI/PurR family transcriptional regulator
MWHMVADRIIASLDQVPMPRVAEVEVELIVRSSTGPAPSV